MATPKVVADATAKSKEFYVTASAENADEFADVDIFIIYGDAEGEALKTIQADKLMSKIPAFARGSVVTAGRLHPAGRLGQPVAAVDRLGSRRLRHAARRRRRQGHVSATGTPTLAAGRRHRAASGARYARLRCLVRRRGGWSPR